MSAGKTIRSAFTRTSATTNGQIARDASLSPIRPMLQATKSRLPTGGVMPPMVAASVNTTPKWIGS